MVKYLGWIQHGKGGAIVRGRLWRELVAKPASLSNRRRL